MKIRIKVGNVELEYSENQKETAYITLFERDTIGGLTFVKSDRVLFLIKELADKTKELYEATI